MNRITTNAEVVANGPGYANGPVYVMGMDIKSEIERIKSELELIKNYKPEQIENVINQLLEKNILQEESQSELKSALNVAIKITDWASRVQFWYETLKLIKHPLVIYLIMTLLKLQQ